MQVIGQCLTVHLGLSKLLCNAAGFLIASGKVIGLLLSFTFCYSESYSDPLGQLFLNQKLNVLAISL
ncbi:unnamed protein product [Caretta caretta]